MEKIENALAEHTHLLIAEEWTRTICRTVYDDDGPDVCETNYKTAMDTENERVNQTRDDRLSLTDTMLDACQALRDMMETEGA